MGGSGFESDERDPDPRVEGALIVDVEWYGTEGPLVAS